MKHMKAVWYGALLWVLIFFEISILMFGFGMEDNSIYYVHYIINIALVLFLSMKYFKHQNSTYMQGLCLGLIFVGVGIVLDALITIPLFVKEYNFFLNPFLWGAIVETLAVATIYGGLRKP